MQIARVVGTVVSTHKHRAFEGAKLLLVQPVSPDDTPRGVPLLAIDSVGAGEGDDAVGQVLTTLAGAAAAAGQGFRCGGQQSKNQSEAEVAH